MDSLVNISERVSLAMHGLALIAENSSKRVNIKDLAKNLGASQNHLAKVMQALTRAGIVNSVRGPSGGFQLNNSSVDISFLDIYEIIEGRIQSVNCPLGKSECYFTKCVFDGKLNHVTDEIQSVLKNIKVSSFIKR